MSPPLVLIFPAGLRSTNKKDWCSGTRHPIIKVNGGNDHQTHHEQKALPHLQQNPLFDLMTVLKQSTVLEVDSGDNGSL